MTPAAAAVRDAAETLARKAQSYRTPVAVETRDALEILDYSLARDWYAVQAGRSASEGAPVADCLEELTDQDLLTIYAAAFTPGAEPIIGRIVAQAIKRAVAQSIARQANEIEFDADEPRGSYACEVDDQVRADRLAMARASR